jgi:hypothetical protein
MSRRIASPVAGAVVVGTALWFAASAASGKREPWDASVYWVVAYPVAIAVSAFLGCLFPDRPWRWALVLFEAQFVAMCIRNGELGNLWPIGMLMFAVVALPAMLAAALAARWSKKRFNMNVIEPKEAPACRSPH